MSEALSTLIPFLFLAAILLFANQSEKVRQQNPEAGIDFAGGLAYGLTALTMLLLFFSGIGMQAAGFALRLPEVTEALNDPAFAEFDVDMSSINFNVLGLGFWVPGLFGLLALLPPVRRLLSRIFPIDPANRVHAVALAFIGLIFPNLFLFLGIGLENIAGVLEGSAAASSTGLILTTWAQNLGFFVMGLVGVGWLTRRSWSETLTRLKLTVPSLREVGIGFGLGIIALVVLAAVTAAADAAGLGDPVVDSLSEDLYGPFFSSLAGVLTVGLAAAWGEETIFRGAMQPRFGRILTSFFFAIVHGNYGLSVVSVAIFAVGYLLGYIRDRYSTTTAMVTHATFNSVQALLAYLAITYGLGV